MTVNEESVEARIRLDDTDFELLKLLQEDGRATQAHLGKTVGLSGPSVFARIKRMEKAGVISGYTAVVHGSFVGQGLTAFIRVVTVAAASEKDEFEDFVHSSPMVHECHDVDGEDSYLLKVKVSGPAQLRVLLADIRSIEHVARTVSTIALETVKEHGAGAFLAFARVPTAGSDAE
ncbi:Lrp/AsnC family transcriptional regulator [Rhodococcoides fascians]|uniref:Lrp/AsnC family transcriptional regulator n=1 Tax=Rhodococcoides fascians TaxID=1828 RepID=UPI000691B82F|nr:Lrp/AsnC family transcriptional regulator [Rhodococcus fascians]